MVSSRARNDVVSWLVVGPFAIVLAFPFYWMLMTSLKTNGDLYDINHNPFVFNAALAAPNEDQPLRGQAWLCLRRALPGRPGLVIFWPPEVPP